MKALETPSSWLARAVRVGFYPLALLTSLLYIAWAVQRHPGELPRWQAGYLAVLITVLLVLEACVPLSPQWQLNRRDFFQRDLPMFVVNGLSIWLCTQALTAIAPLVAWSPTPLAGWHWVAQAALLLLVGDGLWWGLHRWSHEGQDPVGRWLWRVHVNHHLPDRVYVLMHPAGHPINTVLVRVLLVLPGLVLGAQPAALFAAAVLTTLQGMVSHFNVDSRAGWLNRIFVGTELHRLHHSADGREMGNYAAVLSLWDQLGGTWVYRPGGVPQALGVPDRHHYPADSQWLALLAWPFRADPAPGERLKVISL